MAPDLRRNRTPSACFWSASARLACFSSSCAWDTAERSDDSGGKTPVPLTRLAIYGFNDGLMRAASAAKSAVLAGTTREKVVAAGIDHDSAYCRVLHQVPLPRPEIDEPRGDPTVPPPRCSSRP